MSEDWTEREGLKDGGIHGWLIRNKFVINKEEDSCAKVTGLTHHVNGDDVRIERFNGELGQSRKLSRIIVSISTV